MKKQIILLGFLGLRTVSFAQWSPTAPGGSVPLYQGGGHLVYSSGVGVLNWGNGGANDDLYLRSLSSISNINSYTDRLRIKYNGWTTFWGGSGTNATNPSDQIHVFPSSTANGITITNSSTTNRSAITLENSSSAKKFILGTTGSADGSGSGNFIIRDGTSGDRFNLLSNGNIGIGNANPLHKLSVAGNIAFNQNLISRTQNAIINWGVGGPGYLSFRVLTGAENSLGNYIERMIIDQNGNVGVGPNALAPSQRLDVDGNISVRGAHVVFNSTDGVIDWGNAGTGDLWFRTLSTQGSINTYTDRMIIKNNGNVGIGTTATPAKLTVNGNCLIGDPSIVTNLPAGYKLYVQTGIITEKVKVQLVQWADYVFEKDYKLKSLEEVSSFIKENKHLPGVPSAEEIKSDGGIDVAQMDAKLMEKIEELTLYIIQLNEKNAELSKRLTELEKGK